MFSMAIFMMYICGAAALVALLKGADIVLRYFGHDTIGRFCDRLGCGYSRRVRIKTTAGYQIVRVYR